jgi:uncharacterized membrane protein
MISFNSLISVLTLVTALGCGTIAGVFFAFSTFVMKALARLPANEGIAAMQSINVAAVNSWFLAAFLGTSAACLLVIVAALSRWSDPSAVFLLGGAVAYLVGCFLVTMVFNVPMNDALASLSPTAPDRAARWASYLADWTTWNHVRTLASLAAAALLIMGLGQMPR